VKKYLFLLPIVLFVLAPTPATAMKSDMHHGDQHTDATSVYAKDMEDMHKAMMVAPTGDPDVDFVQGMIPHHQGAVAMAKTLLAHSKDPELRKLAEDIISAQEKEIAFMSDWLKNHPAKK
jgi:uncharacterized protein (DUF305 family)